MRWTGYVARRGACKIFVGEPEGMVPLGIRARVCGVCARARKKLTVWKWGGGI
jgi:hypothetical protein